MPVIASRLTGRHERGAIAIMLGLTLPVLLMFAAISLDMGQVWAQRRAAAAGADAAVLAIAQKCSTGTCGDTAATAKFYAQANGSTSATVTKLVAGRVSVTVDAPVNLMLAGILNVAPGGKVSASSNAKWTFMSQASTYPLGVSQCEFQAQTGTPTGKPSATGPDRVILSEPKASSCTTYSTYQGKNITLKGGFVFLPEKGNGKCEAVITADSIQSTYSNWDTCPWAGIETQVRAVPIYDSIQGNKYHIAGFAGLKVTGYCAKKSVYLPAGNGTCSNANDYRIIARFVPMATSQALAVSNTSGNYGTAGVLLD